MTVLDEAPLALDEDDGAPTGEYPPGAPLPGGVRAWERLGVGQRCETWLAWSDELWCPAVVKLPRPHQITHPRARRALRREVAALAGNLHPALPRLYADGTTAAVPHLVLEYLDGVALDDELDEHGALEPAEAGVLAVRVLSALRSIHARGLVHVDVKPANVVLRDGRAVLIDLGSARAAGAPQPAGRLIGSPGYAAPDLEAGEPVCFGMDVYGVGVTLHEALTGQRTFDPGLPAAERPSPAALPESPLASLVMGMLDGDPAARPTVDEALREATRLADPGGELLGPAWAR